MKRSIFLFCFFLSYTFCQSTGSPRVLDVLQSSAGLPCVFNPVCKCLSIFDGDQLYTNVTCSVENTFPDLSNMTSYYNGSANTGASYYIMGTFTSIPKNAITYPVYDMLVIMRPDAGNQIPLSIDEAAFPALFNGDVSVVFVNVYFPVLPTAVLQNHLLSDVEFINGSIPTIPDASFSNWHFSNAVGILNFFNDTVQNIESNAFDNIFCENILKFNFAHNQLTEISPAFNKLTFPYALGLPHNQIAALPDFAFCPSNASLPNYVQELQLDYNPIVSIEDSAFACCPYLTVLSLNGLDFSVIPKAVQNIAEQLQTIYLSFTNLVSIQPNTFYSFHSLSLLDISSNPIKELDAGCFNGLNRIGVQILDEILEITSLDLLVTYGMPNITSLYVLNSNELTQVFLSDSTKLPNSLNTFAVTKCYALSTVDSSLAAWLDISTTNHMSVQDLKNFLCDSNADWMAKYFLCTNQIFVKDVFCKGSKMGLATYLTSLQPKCV